MMCAEKQERALEVLNLPPEVDTELLTLYFKNKRRSGGGPLVSVEKKGDRAILVFEEAEAAARVLRQEGHVLENAALRLRRPACKDQHRLLLRGISPSTPEDILELYVENVLGLNMDDYQLHFTPARDSVLIHLSQPLSEDFHTLSAAVSQRSLNGASMTLEEIKQTDSVLVGNLHPDTSPDALCLYFESEDGNHIVMDVTKLSESTARVSFADYDSVDLVLAQPHRLKGASLEVGPYFDFLEPARASITAAHPPSSHMPCVDVELEDFIPIVDPVKLDLFQMGGFQREVKKTHPDVTVEVRDSGVHVKAADRHTFEQVKGSLLEYFCRMSATHFTLEPQEAEFLSRAEVRQRLQPSLDQTPALYAVSDSSVVVTALSCNSALQACSFLKCQLAHVRIPMDSTYKSIFISEDWVKFLEELPLSSIKVSIEDIDVLTLKGMEREKHMVVLDFLTSQTETEVVVCMEPGVLKYIQTHCHQLLVYMDQVSVVPLEATDVSGLKIYGHVAACNTAQEMLQDIISSIRSETFTVSAPGIARYLHEKECKMFLSDMEKMYEVCVLVKEQLWEPPGEQDIFQAAWAQLSTKNFRKSSVDAQESVSVQNNPDGVSELLENAKVVISAIEDGFLEDEAGADQGADLLNLYTAEEDEIEAPDVTGASLHSTIGSIDLEDEVIAKDLEEEAKLSLAIQYSIESSRWSSKDEEEQLQRALSLSKEMSQHEDLDCTEDQLNEAINASLEEAVKATNTAHLHVFSTQDDNLLRVDTAFKKSVSQKQVVEKLNHHTVVDVGEYHRKCVEAIERKHGVEIHVEGTVVNISGFKKFVSEALSDTKLLLNRMSHSASDQEILRKVQWVFHDPASPTPTPYSPEVTVVLENAWKMKMRKVDILLDNQHHVMNFTDMYEHSTTSGKSVTISRESFGSEVVDYNQLENNCSQLTSLPNATKLEKDSNEYRLVMEAFNKNIQEYRNKIRIVQVDKLLNRLLYHQYQLKRMSIQQTTAEPEFEKILYHGTRGETVKEICLTGFNRSFCGKNATMYGQGVYFAVKSALSLCDRYSPPNADGHKFVFVSRVLTGDYTKGYHSMKAAPHKETGKDNMPFRYDSVTDNVENPEIFVIFNDTQAFPEYLITCEKVQP